MEGFVTSREDWLKEYNKDRRSIWITVSLSDGRKLWFKDHKKWEEIYNYEHTPHPVEFQMYYSS